MKNMLKNMSASIVFKVVTIITNLIVQQRILVHFGSDINGVSSSIMQFINYLVLLEAGIGAASIQALYLPLASKDWDDVNGILSATKIQYRRISIAFGALLLGLACAMPVITSHQIESIIVFAITIFAGSTSFISYLFTGKYSVLLNADRKINVIYTIDTVLAVVSCGLRITAIHLGYGIIVVQSILAMVASLKAIIVYLYVRRKYGKLNLDTPPKFERISKHKNVLVHKLASVVVNHTDVTILTIASSLKTVSVYSVYNFIYANLASVVDTTFSQAAQGSFGHLISKSQKDYNKALEEYEYSYSLILYILLTVAFILTIPFIRLYTAGVNDINYISQTIALLFALNQFMNLIRIPSLVTIQAYGWFQETQKGAIIEAVINITVSLILLPFLGMRGLLIGTFCSYLFRTQDVIRFVYRRCSLNWKSFFANNLLNLIIAVLLSVLFIVAFPMNPRNWLNWILYAIAVTVIVSLVFIAGNLIFRSYNCRQMFRMAKRMISNGKE